jgi:lipopolysaccharide/colanic/teichoic acid biosynthesis glycosyltransferase
MEGVQGALKRAWDIGFTLIASVFLLPLAVTAALCIWATSGTPVLHGAERVGRDGRRFTLYKFRTMVSGAQHRGPGVTRRGDPRITGIGRILRKTKFDEFPQVLNVLRGDMSIVGPRPEAPEYVDHYSGNERPVLSVRPGLTSLAQVLYRDEEALLPSQDTESFYLQEVMPRKLALDLYYVAHWSLTLDLCVFLMGVFALLGMPFPRWLWPAGLQTAAAHLGAGTRHA